MNRAARRIGTIAVALCLGCQSSPSFVIVHPPVASVRITPSNDTIPFAGMVSLQATTLDAEGQATVPDHRPVWSSLSPSILTVDTAGTVHSIWYGQGFVRVQVDGHEAEATVFITDPPIDTVVITSGPAQLERGDTGRVKATAYNTVQLPVTGILWSVSDTTVLKVDSTGKVTGLKIGTASVRAALQGRSAFLAITVVVPVASFTVFPLGSFVWRYDSAITLHAIARDSAGAQLTDRTIALRETGGAALALPGALAPGETTAVLQDVAPGTVSIIASVGRFADTLHVTAGALALRSIMAGTSVTCGLTADSLAYCWGFNGAGALGTGDTLSGPRPRRVRGGLSWSGLMMGAGFACGWVADGTAYCWGSNDAGQLGNGSTTGALTPAAVSGGLHFSELGVDGGTVCGLTTGGEVYCWGAFYSAGPTLIATGILFGHLLTGGGGECAAAASDGSVYCWAPGDSVTALAGSMPLDRFLGGISQSCGLVGSSVYCWNPFTSWFSGSFRTMSAGAAVSCGISGAGVSLCEGDDGYGELGRGPPPAEFNYPYHSDTLVAVMAPVPFTSITAGSTHVCALGIDGLAYCWGSDISGEGGYAMTLGARAPVLVMSQ